MSEQVEREPEFNVHSLRREASNCYGDLITSFVGDLPVWLVTITHEKLSYHPEQSVRVRRHWLNKINQDIFGGHYDRRGEGVMSFFGLEWQKRGTVHQHGVIAGDGLLSQKRSDQCFYLASAARGWCRIELPRNRERGIRYCTKYLSKGGELDWWLPRGLKLQTGMTPGLAEYRRDVVTA